MSSMAQQAIEMGIDPCIAPGGGTWDNPTNREYACSVASSRGYTPDYLDDDINNGKNCREYNNYSDSEEPTWFATSKEALDYAKKYWNNYYKSF